MITYDVAIVGAGPYGLSVAAHLRAIGGLDVQVFGEPMSFWQHQMPVGMRLRSPWAGSHLSDPDRKLTLDAYRTACGNGFAAPVALRHFVDYGRWFQRQAVPDVDQRQVIRVEAATPGFCLTLADATTLKAQRVVVAAGIGAFAWCPAPFQQLPAELVSHTSSHAELRRFAGQHVVVIGAGQSALESAALMQEAGVQVELLVREPQVHWLWQRPWLHQWPLEPLLYAPPDVGPALVSQLVARPHLFSRLPRVWQDRLGIRSIIPAGAAWLKPRLDGVPTVTGRHVVSAVPVGQRIKLHLDNGAEKTVDHVLLGTGYRVDIRKYAFLATTLLSSIRHIDGYPQLSADFESSVPGLFFVGAPAAWRYGPLMRFVAGADFTSRCLARGIVNKYRKY